jgi:hypothetical protein
VGFDSKPDAVLHRPAVELWRCGAALEMTYWAVIGVALFGPFVKLVKASDGQSLTLWLTCAVAFAVALLPVWGGHLFGPDVRPRDIVSTQFGANHASVMKWLEIVMISGTLVAMIPFSLLVDAAGKLHGISDGGVEGKVKAKTIAHDFGRARDTMGLQFGVVAGLIFMATLSTVLLRRALLPTQAGPAIAQVASASPSPVTYTIKLPPKEVDDGFPSEYVLFYSVFYSAILAIIYVPANLARRRAARAIAEAAVPETTGADLLTILEGRAKLESSLQQSAFEGIQALLGVIAPLITGMVAIAVGKS